MRAAGKGRVQLGQREWDQRGEDRGVASKDWHPSPSATAELGTGRLWHRSQLPCGLRAGGSWETEVFWQALGRDGSTSI